MAATEATKEALWLRGIIKEMAIPQLAMNTPTPISIDNNSAMRLSRNPEFHARTKHIAMRHHFIREHVANGDVKLERIDTKNNIADILTKALPRPRFVELVGKMNMKTTPEDIATLR